MPYFLDPDPQYDALRIENSRDHLRKLAIVHNVDWKAAGFDEIVRGSDSPENCAREYVDWIKAEIDATQSAGATEEG